VVAIDKGPYYAEFFDVHEDATRDDVSQHFAGREQAHPDLQLVLLLDRIGRLGPDPRGVAVWSLPNYGAISQIATELDGVKSPLSLVTAGTYDDVGSEIF
jgi:hypothetical protein